MPRWRAPSSRPRTSRRSTSMVTRVAAAPLEPRAAVGEFDRRTGRYTLHTGIQGPHGLRAVLAEQVFRVPHERPARGHGRGRRKLRHESGVYPGARARAVGGEAAGAAGQVDVRSARGLRHRRARPRQRLDRRAGARRRTASSWPARRHQAEHRRLSHAAQRGARHQQRRRPGGRLHDAGDPRADAPACSRTRRRPDRIAAPGGRRRRTRSSASSTWPRASSGSIRSSCAAATSSRPRRCRSRPGSSSPTTAASSRAAWTWRWRSPITRGSRSGGRRPERQGKLLGLGIANPIEVAGGPYTAVNPGHRRAARQSRRLRLAVRGLDLDGPGQRDGVHADRERSARRAARRASRCSAGDSDALGTGRGNGGSGALSVGGSAVRARDREG